MKKKTLFLGAFAAVCLVACSNTGNNGNADNTVKTDSVKYEQNGKGIEISIKADFPEQNTSALYNSIAEYISEQLGGTYTGSLEHSDSIVDFYGQAQQDSMKKEQKDFGGPDDMAFSYSYEIKKDNETAEYVTFTTFSDTYLGGAHGSHYASGATFRKSDGRKFGFDMLRNTDSEAFHTLLKDGLKDYFKELTSGKNMSDDQLKDLLMTEASVDWLPLPVTPPYLTKDGVTFVYQNYEIAPYAAGMPTFTVPYSKIKPFLTYTVIKLIK